MIIIVNNDASCESNKGKWIETLRGEDQRRQTMVGSHF